MCEADSGRRDGERELDGVADDVKEGWIDGVPAGEGVMLEVAAADTVADADGVAVVDGVGVILDDGVGVVV